MDNTTVNGQEFWNYATILAIASGLFIVMMSLIFLLFAGNMIRLDCLAATGQQVDCSLENSWLGLFKISAQAIQNVQQAEIGEHCDEDGDCTYRLELISGESSRIPLVPFYSSGRDEKRLAQEQINAYLQQPAPGNLAILIPASSRPIASVLLSALVAVCGSGCIAWGILKRREMGSPTHSTR